MTDDLSRLESVQGDGYEIIAAVHEERPQMVSVNMDGDEVGCSAWAYIDPDDAREFAAMLLRMADIADRVTAVIRKELGE